MDMFRGEYARLDYDISHVDGSLLRDGLTKLSRETRRTNIRVYAALDTNDGPAKIIYLTDKKPKEGTFIRGWFRNDYYSASGGTIPLNVQYGIEAYFVEQGSSRNLQRPRRQDIAMTLEMEAALSKEGTAVLKGYRFCPLGLGIEPNFMQEPNTSTGRGLRRIKSVTLKLLNASDKPIAIIDLPQGGSFALEEDTMWYSPEQWRWVGRDLPRDNPQNGDVHILKPDEIYLIKIDLTRAQWFVKQKDKLPLPLNELNWERFRLVYRPPSKEQCRDLDNAEIIWHGYIYSPAFSGGRGFD
jgi:uncharacterized membrane-anchored protein